MKNIATQLAAVAMAISSPVLAQDNTDDQPTSKAATLSAPEWIFIKSAKQIQEEHSSGMAAAAVATEKRAPSSNLSQSFPDDICTPSVSIGVSTLIGPISARAPQSCMEQQRSKTHTGENYKVSCEGDGGSIDISVKNGETKIHTTDVFGSQNYETTRSVFKSAVDAINSAKAQCDIGIFSYAAQKNGLEIAVGASSALVRHSPETSSVKVKFEIQ